MSATFKAFANSKLLPLADVNCLQDVTQIEPELYLVRSELHLGYSYCLQDVTQFELVRSELHLGYSKEKREGGFRPF